MVGDTLIKKKKKALLTSHPLGKTGPEHSGPNASAACPDVPHAALHWPPCGTGVPQHTAFYLGLLFNVSLLAETFSCL